MVRCCRCLSESRCCWLSIAGERKEERGLDKEKGQGCTNDKQPLAAALLLKGERPVADLWGRSNAAWWHCCSIDPCPRPWYIGVDELFTNEMLRCSATARTNSIRNLQIYASC